MSIIFIQVGQCGNQVGHEFWKLMSKERSQKNAPIQSSFFHGNGYARCIMIDSEPKVIQNILTENTNNMYKLSNVRFSQSGCGNNWALGYHFGGNSKGLTKLCAPENIGKDVLLNDALDLFRLELESCDYAKACVVIHSLSGGTGSGLGSHIIEELKKQYPSLYIISICIAPYQHGDTPMQHYNCLLSLTYIQKFCDSVLMFQNDDILRAINKNVIRAGHVTRSDYSTTDVNKYIASCLAGLFLPIQNEKGEWAEFDCFKFIRTLCPNYDTKFLDVQTSASLMPSAQKFSSWQYIAEDFVKQVPLYMLDENIPSKNIFTKVIARGGLQNQDYNAVKKVLLSKTYTPVEWLLYSGNQDEYLNIDVSHANALPSYKVNQSLTVCSNRTYIIVLLNHVLSKAHVMMESNAYVHWYSRHGVDEQFFDECFSTVQQVIDDYVLLYKPGVTCCKLTSTANNVKFSRLEAGSTTLFDTHLTADNLPAYAKISCSMDNTENPSTLVTIDIDDNAGTESLLNVEHPVSYEESTKNIDIDALYAPFVRPDYPIGWYEKIKIVLNAVLLIPIRAILIGTLCVVFWVLSKLAFIGMPEDKRTLRYLHGIRRGIYLSVGIFCRIGLFVAGFYNIQRYNITQKQVDKIRASDLKIRKNDNENKSKHAPYTIVSNHISMIDIIVLLSEFNVVSFLALDRLKDTIFFGEWMQQINCLFVTNEKKGLVDQIFIRQEQYHHTLEEDKDPTDLELPPRLVIFPEGTTTNGGYHILFHRGAFTSGLPVQPVVIRYPWNHFCPSWETIPISTYYFRLLTQFCTYCYVVRFPVYYPSLQEQKDPSVYASNVRHVMTKCTNRLFTKRDREWFKGGLEIQKVGNQTRKDKMSLHSRILAGEFEWTKNKNFYAI